MKVSVCSADAIPAGELRQFCIDGAEVLVGRTVEGELIAACGTCPHRGAQLGGGRLDGKVVTCPWHEWSFDLSDGSGITNPQSSLDCYAVAEVDGQIVVELPD